MALSPSPKVNDDGQPQPNDFSQFLRRLADEFPDLEGLPSCSNFANSITGQTDQGTCVQRLRYLSFNDLLGREQCIREFRHLKGNQTFQNFSILVATQYSASRSRATNEKSKISFSSRNTSSTSLASRSFGASTSFDSIFSKDANVDSTQTSFTDPLGDASLASCNGRDYRSQSRPLLQVPYARPNASLTNNQTHSLAVAGHPQLQLDDFRDRFQYDPDEHFQTRRLPAQGLFGPDLNSTFDLAPWPVRFECLRLANFYGISVEDLEFPSSEPLKTPLGLLNFVKSSSTGRLPSNTYSQNAPETDAVSWDLARRNSHQVILKGVLTLTPHKADSAFKLTLSPLHHDRKSCRLVRKFGAHRFLRLAVPDLSRSENRSHHLKDEKKLVERFQQWLLTDDKELLRCRWSVLYMKLLKSTTKQKRQSQRVAGKDGHEVFLFATSGPDLEDVTLEQVFNWFMCLRLNASMTYAKAYARLDLAFSSTISTFVFKPSQVKDVPNQQADHFPEDESLRDPRFLWPSPGDRVVMNDGSCRMSRGAGIGIWRQLNGTGNVPSAFQARIGPAKGVWVVSDAGDDCDVWIELSESQRKFIRHHEDYDDERCDPLRLTFEVNSWAEKPSKSSLSLEYPPILEDRGVSRLALYNLVQEGFQAQYQAAHDAVTYSSSTRRWLQENCNFITDAEARTWPTWATVINKADRAKWLTECGFKAKTFSYLKDLLTKIFSRELARSVHELRLALPKSTYLLGVADPKSCLAPDQIHIFVSDSSMFNGHPCLDRIDVLVSRHPARRASDIQKVRARFKPELSHLVNVVVFPTKGSFPLAGKLQGGDYDGDRFWVCWEESLIKDFHNAPAPYRSPSPSQYGIKQDKTTCAELGGFTEFRRRSMSFQLQRSFLGVCANHFDRVVSFTGSLHDPAVKALADICDLLLDCAKNGYSLDESGWNDVLARLNLPRNLANPAYKIINADTDLFENVAVSGQANNINDDLIFGIARPEAQRAVKSLEARYDDSISTYDPSLGSFFLGSIRYYESVLNQELVSVLEYLRQKQLSQVFEPWADAGRRTSICTKLGLPKLWALARRKCKKIFQGLEPTFLDSETGHSRSSNHPEVLTWLRRPALHAHSHWDLLKASALFEKFHGKPDFVFTVAGEQLCWFKAHSSEAPNLCVPGIFSELKMRKRKACVLDEEEEIPQESLLAALETNPVDDANDEVNIGIDARDASGEPFDAPEMVVEMSQQLAHSSLEPPSDGFDEAIVKLI